MAKNKWYDGGLEFQCQGCGRCCSGPEEGYIWANKREIAAIAEYLNITEEQLKREYMYREGLRYSFNEQKPSNDCIFLEPDNQGGKRCRIYPVRPTQCRTWPFWKENLTCRETWQQTARQCRGMNQGKWYRRELIDAIGKGDYQRMAEGLDIQQAVRQWIRKNLDETRYLRQVEDVYAALSEHLSTLSPTCGNCGKCCDFASYGHRLYVTTLEMLYFMHGLRGQGLSIAEYDSADWYQQGQCPFQQSDGCRMHTWRPSGCRIFYCDPDLPQAFQNELSEQVIKRLRRLHEQTAAPYYYANILDWLKLLRNLE